VRQWAEGTRSIGRGRDLSRLRGWATRPRSCWLSGTIRRWVQAWFTGLHPVLGDRSPARVLRKDNLDQAGPQVLAAARQFAAVG